MRLVLILHFIWNFKYYIRPMFASIISSGALALKGVNTPPVAILATTVLNSCSIRVSKPKKFYIPATVRLHICNLTVHGIVKKKLFFNCTLFSSHFQSFSLSPTLSPSFPSP